MRRFELKLRGWMGGSPAASGTRCEAEEGVQTHPDKRLLNASWSKTWLKFKTKQNKKPLTLLKFTAPTCD